MLTQNSLKTFVEGIFVTGTLNVNNEVASVVNYSSNAERSSPDNFFKTYEF